jgi:hypothetical protein
MDEKERRGKKSERKYREGKHEISEARREYGKEGKRKLEIAVV